jgi:hypothetical protein
MFFGWTYVALFFSIGVAQGVYNGGCGVAPFVLCC